MKRSGAGRHRAGWRCSAWTTTLSADLSRPRPRLRARGPTCAARRWRAGGCTPWPTGSRATATWPSFAEAPPRPRPRPPSGSCSRTRLSTLTNCRRRCPSRRRTRTTSWWAWTWTTPAIRPRCGTRQTRGGTCPQARCSACLPPTPACSCTLSPRVSRTAISEGCTPPASSSRRIRACPRPPPGS